MIISFANKKIEQVSQGICPKGFPAQILVVARRKLKMVNAARELDDLRIPVSNHLEKLQGNLNGFYSIRVNDQYRVVFRFDDGKAFDVNILDYH